MAVWVVAVTRMPAQRYALGASRTDAIRATRSALESARLGPGGDSFRLRAKPVVRLTGSSWTTAGRATYESLLGTYLNLPGWSVFSYENSKATSPIARRTGRRGWAQTPQS